MKSMTGFGRGEAESGGVRYLAEVSSVNRKQLEVVCTLPPGFGELEREIRTLAQEKLSRGHVRIVVQMEGEPEKAGRNPAINRNLALHYLKELRSLEQAVEHGTHIDLVSVLGLPGVLEKPCDEKLNSEIAKPAVKTAVEAALKALLVMREQEGQHLQEDLADRIDEVRGHIREIFRLSESVVEAQKKRLFALLCNSKKCWFSPIQQAALSISSPKRCFES